MVGATCPVRRPVPSGKFSEKPSRWLVVSRHLIGHNTLMPQPDDQVSGPVSKGTVGQLEPRWAGLTTDELQRRRREIGRGLRRTHYAVAGACGLFGLIALAALWLSAEARHRAADAGKARQLAELAAAESHAASHRLWEFSAYATRQQRLTRAVGQRSRTLEIIREAAHFQPSRELRDEALSALLLPDLGTNLVWHKETGFEFGAAYDPKFEHFIQNCDHGRATVRRVDGTVLMDAAGFGRGTVFWQFSPDGRLAAVAFKGGQLGVWDWRQTNLLAQFPSIDAEWAEPPFDFSPEGQYLWVLSPSNSLQQYAIATRKLETAILPEHPASFVRLSPSGKFAAIACRQRQPERGWVEVWELASQTRRATLSLTNDIWRMAWHPDEERLAVGGDGGFFLWNIGAPEPAVLRRGGALRSVFFSSDGNLLFSSGDGWEGQFWSIRDRQVLLELRAVAALDFSRDQTQLSLAEGRVGYGVRQYLPPLGRRDWPAPPSLGERSRGGGLDPQERWLLTAHPGGWLLREANLGRELLRVQCELTGLASFDHTGASVLAWTTQGLTRWPIQVAENGALTLQSEQSFPSSVPQVWSASCFSADRRFAACPASGKVVVLNTDDPTRQFEVPLRRSWDNSLYLSPDGHWLVTGYHNQHGLDLYDLQARKFIRTFAEEGFSAPVFASRTGRLFTCTATEYCEWNLETGELKLKSPWRTPAAYQGFLGFSSDDRLALVKSSPNSFQLYDVKAGRDFATLDFREPHGVYSAAWSHDGQRLFLFGNDGGVTRLDLAALRGELATLSLDWSDESPTRDFPDMPAEAAPQGARPQTSAPGHEPRSWRKPPRLIWLVSGGFVVTIGIGLYILRYQRRLFTGYLETEALAARRERELHETQDALLHGEKMKALGTLSAGIAHDFNNLLSVIRLSNELIEEQVQPQGLARENFEAIQQAVHRGRGIVNSMLGYARDDGQPRQFAAAELISEAVALLGKSFLGGLVLRVEVQSDTPLLMARKGRIEQMLFNLIVNAAEAMRGRGTLTLSARPAREPTNCLLAAAPASGFVELAVEDTGPGIAPEILPRIFEPFFTTKNVGAKRGTGLGLSMVYAMAKEDGIGVALSTQLGRGTTFRLLLPLRSGSESSVAETGASGRDSPIAQTS